MAEHIHHHEDSGASSMAVVLIALLVIAGLAVFALRVLPFQAGTGDASRTDINVDVPAVDTPADVNPVDGE
jgi:hypothetical protein